MNRLMRLGVLLSALAMPAPAAQAPPDTEIYLAPMKIANGAIEIGPAVNITNNPGYDNQPFFTPDGQGVLFTSFAGLGRAGRRHADRYLSLRHRRESRSSQVTHDARERVLADGHAGGRTSRSSASSSTPTRRSGSGSSTLDGTQSASRARERQAGRLSRVGRRPHARAVRPRASPRRCSSPTRAPAPRSCSPPTSAARSSGSPDVGAGAISFVQRERSGDTVNLVDQGAESLDAGDLGADARGGGQHRSRLRLDARRHAADGEGWHALRLAARAIGMERSRVA